MARRASVRARTSRSRSARASPSRGSRATSSSATGRVRSSRRRSHTARRPAQRRWTRTRRSPAPRVTRASVKGGSNGVTDLAGNELQADKNWSFTTAAPPPPPPTDGPGGPVLVVGSGSNPFGRYYAEILRAEGLNAFTATDVSLLTPGLLSDYDVVVLGEVPLTAAQVTALTDWVQAGGNLIAMRPDPQLAGLLGLTAEAGRSRTHTSRSTRRQRQDSGIVGETIQFHGNANRYTVASACRGCDALRHCVRCVVESRGYAPLGRAERRSGRGVRLRPRAVGRLDASGQHRLVRPGARRDRRHPLERSVLSRLGRPRQRSRSRRRTSSSACS